MKKKKKPSIERKLTKSILLQRTKANVWWSFLIWLGYQKELAELLKNVGETKRTFGTRLEEHRKEADKASQHKYTRAKRKESESHDELCYVRPCCQG